MSLPAQPDRPGDEKFARKLKSPPRRKRFLRWLAGLVLLAGLGVVIYFLPPVHERLAWRVDTFISRAIYAIAPPDQVVFVPQATVGGAAALLDAPTAIPSATLTQTPTAAPTDPLATPTITPTATPVPTATVTPTPLPARVALQGIRFQYQSFNNCGPANLSMALSYWGWQGDQRGPRDALRMNPDDGNVTPAEMIEYAEKQGFKGLVRYGGGVDTLKKFTAAGFPVLIETGEQLKGDWWIGHYLTISGYDDAAQALITQDSLVLQDLPMPYQQIEARGWRDFNYLYLIIYPPERESEVMALLGPDVDPVANHLKALAKVKVEAESLERRDRFFALYAVGTNLLALDEVEQAAAVYDEAYTLYAQLDEMTKERPWRITWYQTGVYETYYRQGRYQDVITLTSATIGWFKKRAMEESHYWRGMAYEALGDKVKAAEDYENALKVRPTYTLALEALDRLKQ